MRKEEFTCDCCGERFPAEQRTEFNGQSLCRFCLDSETVVCNTCGERLWNDSNAGDEDIPLCQPFYDRNYTNCVRCGALLHMDDAHYSEDDPGEEEPLCHDCNSRSVVQRGIQDYYYKPAPIFYGKGSRYMGVELEIEDGGESSSNAKELLSIANRSYEHIYCKHDGSLEEGFEIVTHPMTLDYHREGMAWADILHKAVAMGYKSHQAGTCGLHVHVNRSAFGSTEDEQEACIARVLYFFEKHWEELLKFSRRTQRQLDRWAARYGYKEQPREILEHAKKGYHGGRYTCVNLQNDSTIEFRMFRGTLKLNTLIATLQLVDRICEVAICLSDEEVKNMSWSTFVSGCQAPELVQYLKERRIYVNDVVAAEEEI